MSSLRLVPFSKKYYVGVGGIRKKSYHPSRKIRPHGTAVPPTTDVEIYKTLDTSHLHKWEYRDNLRIFKLKMEAMTKSQESSFQDNKGASVTPKPKSLSLSEYVSRAPTDILEAIASGLKRDYSAPNYRFHDDPYLTPYDYLSSRDFILGKESGKAAARFVFEKHPELFTNNQIEMFPKIPSFLPKVALNPETVTTETLRVLLKGNQIEEAISAYEMLNNVEEDLKLELLERSAYFAESDPNMTEDHADIHGYYKTLSEPWKKGGFVERLAQELEGVPPKLCLLYGFSQHNRHREAIKIFENLVSQGTALPIEAYNSYIRSHIEESLKKKEPFSVLKLWSDELLNKMRDNGIKPNARTLYWLLRGISLIPFRSEEYSDTCEFVLSLLSEFKNVLGVDPSVGSYSALLEIFYPKGVSGSDILKDIIDELEEKDLLMVDPQEFTFLRTAMFVCFLKISDPKLAWRLHNRVTTFGNNEVFLNNAGDHQYYYNFFLGLLISNSSFVSAMDFYEKYTPNLFFCSWLNYGKILNKIERFGYFNYIPSLWSDLVGSRFCKVNLSSKFEMIARILEILNNNEGFPELKDEEARKKVIESSILIAKDTFTDYILIIKKIQDVTPISQILGFILNIVLINGNREGDAIFVDSVVNFAMDKLSELPSPPFDEKTMETYFNLSLDEKRKDSAFKALNYACRHNFENQLQFGRRFTSQFKLSERETLMLNTMFGHLTEWTPLVYEKDE